MQNITSTRQQLITELLTQGVNVINPQQEHVSRHGGAGPSDHQAMNIDGVTVMVPIYTHAAHRSPWQVKHEASGAARLFNNAIPVREISFASKRRTGSPIRTLPPCTARTCWRPPSYRPVFAMRTGRRPASSAPSASRWPPGAPLPGKRRSSWPKWRGRRWSWTG